MAHRTAAKSGAALVLILALSCAAAAQAARRAPTPLGAKELLIRNATVMTVTHGTILNGSVHVKDGKIVAVGVNLPVPASAFILDAQGKYVTPGLIDSHTHIALGDDINEATSPVVPQMMMQDAFVWWDKNIYRALAGGVTSALLLHGSADMIGGQSVIIKTKFGLGRDDLLMPNAPRIIKFASGENPKHVFGSRNQLPSTRMGNFAVQRQALQEAREYLRDWDEYERKKDGATPPKRDLKLEALADLLRGRMMVHAHVYRADEFLTEIAMAREYGYQIRAFVHALEAYKVPEKLAENHIGITTFADWWGYKYEAWDAIPWNAVLCMRKGVVVALDSDSEDFIRRLNQEAAKTIRYGGATEEEALRMITLNAAWTMGIENRVGSIDVGKDADLVIWNGHPLSSYGIPEKVFIDGELFFDRTQSGYGTTHYSGTPDPSFQEAQ